MKIVWSVLFWQKLFYLVRYSQFQAKTRKKLFEKSMTPFEQNVWNFMTSIFHRLSLWNGMISTFSQWRWTRVANHISANLFRSKMWTVTNFPSISVKKFQGFSITELHLHECNLYSFRCCVQSKHLKKISLMALNFFGFWKTSNFHALTPCGVKYFCLCFTRSSRKRFRSLRKI